MYDSDSLQWKIINYVIDSLFLIDIIVIFNTAYLDEDLVLIEDRNEISCNYLRGWFFIDLLAIIPFDVFAGGSSNANGMVRLTRLGRMHKIIKLLRLLRVLKL